jgi:ribulose-phosphate 3-epimerase
MECSWRYSKESRSRITNMHVRITPSILNADFNNLSSEISKVAADSDLIHLDIMDNIFVPNFTFDFNTAARIISECPIPVDAHLMVANVDRIGVEYAETGADSVTFHIEASENPEKLIHEIKKQGARVGVAIKPNTSFNAISHLIEQVDMVLVMTVEPGFGGQSFMENQMEKVAQVRSALKSSERDIWLQVDGGISAATIEIATRAGADTFVAGSAVYKSADPAEMVRKLRSLAVNQLNNP